MEFLEFLSSWENDMKKGSRKLAQKCPKFDFDQKQPILLKNYQKAHDESHLRQGQAEIS